MELEILAFIMSVPIPIPFPFPIPMPRFANGSNSPSSNILLWTIFVFCRIINKTLLQRFLLIMCKGRSLRDLQILYITGRAHCFYNYVNNFLHGSRFFDQNYKTRVLNFGIKRKASFMIKHLVFIFLDLKDSIFAQISNLRLSICKPRHWNLGIGIAIRIGTDVTNAIVSSSIRPMNPKLSMVVT